MEIQFIQELKLKKKEKKRCHQHESKAPNMLPTQTPKGLPTQTKFHNTRSQLREVHSPMISMTIPVPVSVSVPVPIFISIPFLHRTPTSPMFLIQ